MPAEPKPGWMPARRPAWALAVLLALLLGAPVATAFASPRDPLHVEYDAGRTPVVFATGEQSAEGSFAGGFLAADILGLALREIPALTVIERDPSGAQAPREQTHRGHDLVVHSGTLAWVFQDGAALAYRAKAPYAMTLALPNLPLPRADGGTAPSAGVVLAGRSVDARLAWTGAGDLLLLDAEVSILAPNGAPVSGWSHRDVNVGGRLGEAARDLSTLVRVSGAFEGEADAQIQGGTFGATKGFTLAVSQAEEDGFLDALDVLDRTDGLMGQQEGGSPFAADGAMGGLSSFSALLNGAVLVVSRDSEGVAIEPRDARLGDDPFSTSPMSLARGDMEIGWSADAMRIQGTPAVAISPDGFAATRPAALGLFPVVSVVLWAIALGALAWFLIKRPPKADAPFTLRMGSLAVHVVVLLAVLWWWDHSFAETFGTSVLTLLKSGGAFDDMTRFGVVLSFQMAPWLLAAFCFALPVRIALGVALRYLGKGKSLKGVAKAAGLVSLAVFGPLYALWLLDAALGQAVSYLPSMGV